jgi:hypothetical protein
MSGAIGIWKMRMRYSYHQRHTKPISLGQLTTATTFLHGPSPIQVFLAPRKWPKISKNKLNPVLELLSQIAADKVRKARPWAGKEIHSSCNSRIVS